MLIFPLALSAQGIFLELNLNEKFSSNPFARPKQPLELFRVIHKATYDKKIRGIVLNIASVRSEADYLWEIRSALEKFKAQDKKIIAFISNADIDIYTLASVADTIVMDELGALNILGYSAGKGYMKQSLEKLGIGVRELRYFEYKSAGETFTRNSMSEADRRQNDDYLDDIFYLTRDTLKNARNWTDEKFDTVINREFMYSAKEAKDKGLVDKIGRSFEVQQAASESMGSWFNIFAVYGDAASSITGARLPYAPPKARSGFFRGKPPLIAVVYADGQTDMQRGMEAAKLNDIICELADKRRVKAIVIRMNSPGGSAEAADYFSEAVLYAKIKKPVVVSMGQVAASGGYWASMNASHIMATPYTITGSIGVIGNWFYDKGLNEKLGISIDTLKRGEHSDLYTGVILPQRDLSADEEERYKTYILNLYDIFVTKAARGRGMEKEKVEAAAQGRIFSGVRALEAGLIDSIGGLSDALRTARELAGIPENRQVRYEEYPKPKFIDRLLENFPETGVISSKDIRYRLENNGKIMPILPLN
jgi:protease-4